jgi:hypothetical protein
MPPFLALLLRFRRKGVAAHNTRGDMSIPSTAVLGLSGHWGSGLFVHRYW